ncbi:LysR substrate-binding domain-containing protein [Pseudochrobactrum sp. MP213Fo]|uniref:LysR substrate-binding domain-containing protein n=1 Tax=Pseudochrobactrum sp. MP213Fo TaxID=3022250 RepID=UPI003BA38A90
MPRLPPLNALRVFHTVIRYRSFRKAADELFVSPQAVSQQIKLLEDTLGIPLFDRKGRTVDPTEQAILLAHFVQAGFDEFAEGVRRVTKAGHRNRINVNASPYFATRYLMDRLEQFRTTMPGVVLQLTTMVEIPDFSRDDIDVSIQWGFGEWGDYDKTLLVRDPKIICCAPALAHRVRKPEDLLSMTLLHPVMATSLWQKVLRHLDLQDIEAKGDVQFQDAATMRRATLAGMGVGLISAIDAIDDLRQGRLIAPLGTEVLSSMKQEEVPGFYLVMPRGYRRIKTIAAFCDWIRAEDWSATLRREMTTDNMISDL